MLLTTLRSSWSRSALSNAAFRNALLTVATFTPNLYRLRLLSTTARALKEDEAVSVRTSKLRSKEKGTKSQAVKESKEETEAVNCKAKAAAQREVLGEKARAKREAQKARKQARREALKVKAEAKKERERAKKAKKQAAQQELLEEKRRLSKIRPPFPSVPRNAFQNWLKSFPAQGKGLELTERAAVWATMSDEEKSKYKVDPQAHVEYREKYQEWYKNLSFRERKAERARVSRGSYTRPFSMFVREQCPKSIPEGQTIMGIMTSLGLAYKKLGDVEKTKYLRLAKEHDAARKANSENPPKPEVS